VSVACPHCQHEIKLKGVKAGRFNLKCPKCAQPFTLTVPAEPGQPLSATAITTKNAKQSPKLEPTVAEPEPTAAETGACQAPSEGPGDETAIWDEQAQEKARGPGKRVLADTRPAKEEKAGAAPESTDFATEGPLEGTIGGYEIIKQLGQGGMGIVYLARQLSLDRKVALKVMNSKWVIKPNFLVRFTREAYAAAQLVHHNIVQIYDIGADRDQHYFSMEFVQGQNLGQLLEEQGPLDVEVAVGYILQAARGLKFAHDQGMVHRDIKPDNLLLNDQGLVKVADLGLVKTPGAVTAEDAIGTEAAPAKGSKGVRADSALSGMANVTAVGVAMGTPTYMAPEQGRNAATVDCRADVYSLGCTLYVLLTGQAPFKGKTAVEIITKHFTEPVVPPDVLVKRVPKEISAILLKMMAKKPEERQQDMGQVIADMEKFLGVQRAGPFTPREEHANLLEDCVKQYSKAPTARLRAKVIPGFFAACAGLFVLCALFRWPTVAAGVLGLAFMTAAGTFLLNGLAFRTHLFIKVRELILESGWTDWLVWGVCGLLIVLVLYLLGLLWVTLGFLVVAVLLAGAYHVLVERKLAEQRKEPVRRAEGLLKVMRLGGLEEEAIRQFICKYGGDQWEPLYEALFGYEYLLQARQLWARGDTGRRRPRHAAWRDPLVQWIEARQKAVKEARERKHLQKLEQKNLEAKGLKAAEARAQAEEAAKAMVAQAAALKEQARGDATRLALAESPTVDEVTVTEAGPRVSAGSLLAAANQGRPAAPRRRRRPLAGVKLLLRSLTGNQVRFFIGLVLIGICLWWTQQNPDLSRTISDFFNYFSLPETLPASKPLQVVLLPEFVAQQLFSSFNPGVAGLLLILSVLWSSLKMRAGMVAGALVIFLGPWGLEVAGLSKVDVPLLGELTGQTVSLLAGLLLAVLGCMWGWFADQD
jgi:serine/threonine protein kinase